MIVAAFCRILYCSLHNSSCDKINVYWYRLVKLSARLQAGSFNKILSKSAVPVDIYPMVCTVRRLLVSLFDVRGILLATVLMIFCAV